MYRPRLAAILREAPEAWGDEHGLFFHVPRLDFAHPHLTEGLRAKTGGRDGLPAIVVITTNEHTDAHWKMTYGSRATATRALVKALGSKHLVSAYVQPKSQALELKPPGDGALPNGRSQFAILLDRALTETEFQQLLQELRTRQAP